MISPCNTFFCTVISANPRSSESGIADQIDALRSKPCFMRSSAAYVKLSWKKGLAIASFSNAVRSSRSVVTSPRALMLAVRFSLWINANSPIKAPYPSSASMTDFPIRLRVCTWTFPSSTKQQSLPSSPSCISHSPSGKQTVSMVDAAFSSSASGTPCSSVWFLKNPTISKDIPISSLSHPISLLRFL
ncbi:hypothetical protein D3C73_827040 [compost metagenome]